MNCAASCADLGAVAQSASSSGLPGSRRPLNPRVAAHEPPAYDDGATTRPRHRSSPRWRVVRLAYRCIRESGECLVGARGPRRPSRDRKSTRLNSSHITISYAVFCLKKKKKKTKKTINIIKKK